MNLNILYQDAHIIVCEKPAGIPTQSKGLYAKDMVSILKNELAKTSKSDKEPYLGLIHRLDQPVGGIMVFTKTPQAAKELSAQLQKNMIKKHYLAVITNDLSEIKESITLIDEMVQNKKDNSSKIVPSKTAESKTAELSYTVKEVVEYQQQPLSLIDVALITGRHHQIRVQTAAHLGGIWGDKKYNPKFQQSRALTTLCLYAYRLEFQHPITKKKMNYQNFPQYDMFTRFTPV